MGEKNERNTFVTRVRAILGQDCTNLTGRLKGEEKVFNVKWKDALPFPFVQQLVNYPRKAG